MWKERRDRLLCGLGHAHKVPSRVCARATEERGEKLTVKREGANGGEWGSSG